MVVRHRDLGANGSRTIPVFGRLPAIGHGHGGLTPNIWEGPGTMGTEPRQAHGEVEGESACPPCHQTVHDASRCRGGGVSCSSRCYLRSQRERECDRQGGAQEPGLRHDSASKTAIPSGPAHVLPYPKSYDTVRKSE
jgi:hypothetical protein